MKTFNDFDSNLGFDVIGAIDFLLKENSEIFLECFGKSYSYLSKLSDDEFLEKFNLRVENGFNKNNWRNRCAAFKAMLIIAKERNINLTY